ncbi:MAG: preprotein translocase subunit SecD [Actinomycetota bacterium]|nr:preprotein translocase subunit SecD [Actinomycetota bacterium]
MNVRRYVIMVTVTVVLIVGAFVGTLISSNRPALGLDLQGGVSVVLFPVKGSDVTTLDTAVAIIRNRVDALGIAEPDVSRQGNTIVIDLPGAKDRQQALKVIGKTAELRFRLVQQQLPPGVLNPPTTTTKPGATTTTKPGGTTTTKGGAAGVPGRTITTAPIAARRPAQQSSTTPTTAGTASTTASTPATTTPSGSTTTQPSTTSSTLKPNTTCKDLLTPPTKNTANASVILPGRTPAEGCYALGPTILSGKTVKTAKASYDSSAGGASGWGVDVTFKGDDFVTKIATPYVDKVVAIELDGVVQSAPKINPGITGRTVRISGSFTQGEAKNLALVLKYGSLPVQFDQHETTSQSVSPTLGKDQLHAGIVAGIVGLGLVAIYMMLYYRLLGVVVWLGLGLTGLVFFALISYLSNTRGLTLTLAGVTGIIVSVGVTVDSYVVYFERLKDEVRSGKTVRSSVESGFKRSFRTIVAADFVSLLGAGVLYELGSGSVRGFAFFLGLSTAIDLVLAYFFMHPLVVLMARRSTLVRLPGIGIASGLDVAGVKT